MAACSEESQTRPIKAAVHAGPAVLARVRVCARVRVLVRWRVFNAQF
jgi:hypothetical protein